MKFGNLRRGLAIEQALLVLLLGGVGVTGLFTGGVEGAIAQPSNKAEQSAEQLINEARLAIKSEKYTEALALAKQANDLVTESRITLEIITAFYKHQFTNVNWSVASAIFNQTESVIAKWPPEIRDQPGMAAVKYQVAYGKAIFYFRQGKYTQSVESSRAAILIAQRIKNKSNVADAMGLQARALNQMGQYNTALGVADQMNQVCLELNDQDCRWQSLRMLAVINSDLGHYEKSIQLLQESLKIARQIKSQETINSVLNGLAAIHSQAGQYEAAQKILLGILNAEPSATVLGNLGANAHALGQYNEAEKYYQKSIQAAKQYGEKNAEARSIQGLGTLYIAMGQPEKSLQLFSQSLQIIRESQDKFLEAIILTDQGRALLALKRLEESEKSLRLAVNIFDSLRANLNDSNKVAYGERIQISYEVLQLVLIRQKKVTEALEISERSRARALADLLASKLPEINSASSQQVRKAPILSQIQAIAKQQNATLIEYSILDNKVIGIWAILPDGRVAYHFMNLEQDLKSLIQATRENINMGPKLPEIRQALSVNLSELHKILIEPIAQYLPKDPEAQIVFLPQNELFLVPFPALKNAKGEYLIENHTITTAPSIQALGLMSSQKTKSPRSTQTANPPLVVGNPIMPNYHGQPLAPLPHSEREAQAIAQIFNTTPLIGNDATEAAVKIKIQQAPIVHLATHGLLDRIESDIPGAIALKDGYLTSSELFDMKLSADLVVLSACQTGNGDLTGDGVIGLSRSLTVAGVPSVVVSLWDVNDEATSQLMRDFYQGMTSKKFNKAKALREATLQAMTDYDDVLGPKGWAAFTLIGDNR
jgi:CHAT domain-containing protein